MGFWVAFFHDNPLTKTGRTIAQKQILLSIVIVIALSIISYFIWDFAFACSFLVGGAISIVPNIVFAIKAFKYAGAQASEKVLDSFYSGEKMKIVLTAILFALAFKFLAIEPIAFFSSFCLVVVIPLLTPFFIKL